MRRDWPVAIVPVSPQALHGWRRLLAAPLDSGVEGPLLSCSFLWGSAQQGGQQFVIPALSTHSNSCQQGVIGYYY